MRIERLRVSRYGRLSDWDTGEPPLPDLVVLLGPNESGKSTLFDCLCTAFFGFSPATRDAHPYAPWDGTNPELRASLRLDDGALIEVHRRLLSSPRGEVVQGDVRTDLGNRPLDFLSWMPRTLFRHVYALRLEEFGSLRGTEWDGVRDRLLGGSAATDLITPREAAHDLESEAQRLWRADRRGHSEARKRQQELEELLDQRRAAAQAETAVRVHAEELVALAEELGGLRREQTETEAALEVASELAALSVRIGRLRELEAEAGDVADLEGLGQSPLSEKEKLLADHAEQGRELQFLAGERAEAEKVIEADPGGVDSALQRADRIRTALGQRERLVRDRQEVARLTGEVQEAERSLRERVPELFAVGWDELDPLAVARIPVEELRAAIRTLSEAEDRVTRAELSIRPELDRQAGGGWAGLSVARIGLSLVVLVIAVFLLQLEAAWAGGAGGVLLVVGAGVLLQPWFSRLELEPKQRQPVGPDPARALEEAHSALVEAQSQFREIVGELPLRARQFDSPDPDLAAQLRRIRNDFGDRSTRMERREALLMEVADVEAEIASLGRECGVEEGPPTLVLDRIEHLLEGAREREKAAAAARAQLAGITRREALLTPRFEETRKALEELDARGEAIAVGRPEDGLRELERRMESARLARERRAELDREGIDPDEVEGRVERARRTERNLLDDPDAIPIARARLKQLTIETREKAERLGALTRMVEGPRTSRTLADVDGEIEATKEAIRAAEQEHDRLTLLAALIREADRRFRQAHQPDVVRRAGEHISLITGGRYDRLFAEEVGTEERFVVQGGGAPSSLEVEAALSTGTREQVYLALRLAAIDHLDSGGERLPLIFDETFSNWDSARRGRVFELLREISHARQLLLFTCHPEFAEEVGAVGGKVIELEPPR